MKLGRYGVWAHSAALTPETAAEAERLGYGTLWLGGSPPAELPTVAGLLDATDALVVATGIVNIWTAPAGAVAESYHRIEGAHPGRFLLGIGVGHREQVGGAYQRPYDALVGYLDALDAAGVPAERRVLAALGPRVLRLAAGRSAGAHPYLTTPAHTRFARDLLGPGVLLAPEHKVVLDTDGERARAVGRPRVARPYLGLSNYLANLRRLGYSDADLAGEGSDRLVDDLVAHGSAERVAARLAEHLEAGADHVALQVLPEERLLPTLRELAPLLAGGRGATEPGRVG